MGSTEGTTALVGACLVFTLSPALHGMLMHEDTSSSSPPNWCRPALLCTLALPTVLLGLKLWESF